MSAAAHWPSCFVTGTDTGVGKTLVAAALVRALAARGARSAGMKPVAAGARWLDDGRGGAWHNEDVDALAAAGSAAVARADLCPYLLPDPLAPHIAAQRAGVTLSLPRMLQAYAALRASADAVVVEGVGGFCVPLGADFGTQDLARALALPVVLVVGLRLGCLNHATLTAEAIAARGLRLAGWVANAIDPQMAEPERNVEALQCLLRAPCMGRLPWNAPADPAGAAGLLDLAPLWSPPAGAARCPPAPASAKGAG